MVRADRFVVDVAYGGKEVEITDDRFEPTTGYSPGCLHNESTWLPVAEARRFATAIIEACDEIDAGGIEHEGCSARMFRGMFCHVCETYAYPKTPEANDAA